MVHAGRQEADVLQGPSGGCGSGALRNSPDCSVLMVCLCVQDAYARGEVFIGSKESGYTALPSLPPNIQCSHWQFGITIVTPDRKFLFACETEPKQNDWMAAFQTVINRPMLPQEYAGGPSFQLFLHLQTLLNLSFFFFAHFFYSGGVFQTQTMTASGICKHNDEEGGIWSLHHHSQHRATTKRQTDQR